MTTNELSHRLHRYGLNPCFDEGTMVLTRKGHFRIEELVGEIVEIWNGHSWEETSFRVTGENQDIYVLTLADNQKVFATGYHRFILEDYSKVILKELKEGDVLLTHTQIPEDRVVGKWPFVKHFLQYANYIKSNSTQWNVVKSVEFSHIAPKVYCCTVESNHIFGLSNGLLVGNCGEIIGSDYFCVSGDTKLITRGQTETIGSIAESAREVEVWNGQEWALVKPIKTGENRKLVRVQFGDGTYLDTTEDHEFSVNHRFQKEWYKVKAADLETYASRYTLRTEPFEIVFDNEEPLPVYGIGEPSSLNLDGNPPNIHQAYTYGVLVGDGSINKQNNPQLVLFGDKILLPVLGNKSEEKQYNGYSVPCVEVTGLQNDGIYSDLIKDLKTSAWVLDQIAGTWPKDSILHFVAGLADSDGSQAGNAIRIYVSDYDRAYSLLLLLLKCGIRSSVNLMSPKGTLTNYGTRSKDMWYLQITDCRSIPCKRLDTSRGGIPSKKGRYQTIRSITPLPGLHTTYCFTEPKTHKAVFGATLTYQCNLVEVHLNQIDPTDINLLTSTFYLAGQSVSSLLNHEFTIEKFRESRELDPIVGVSFTGLFDFFVNAFGVEWLQWWANGRPDDEMAQFYDFKNQEIQYLLTMKYAAQQGVAEYCDTHGLKRPNRCTTVQPAGTKSLLTGASSGWNAPKAARYIRRITFSKNDPVALASIDYGYSVVPAQKDTDENGNLLNDPFDPRCTEWLVEIPVETCWANLPGVDDIDISQFSALAQFDFYMQVQKYYTEHNTSATIEFREHEIDELSERIYQAIQDDEGYISAALLARFDCNATFPRLPFEPISKEKYEQLTQEVLERRISDDFHALLLKYDTEIKAVEGPSGCDSDKCLLPESPNPVRDISNLKGNIFDKVD